MAFLENSIAYSVILGVSKSRRFLKNIIIKNQKNIRILASKYRTWKGLWPPPASKENPAPDQYNCNVTAGIVNLPQATLVKCLANVIMHNSFVRKANVMQVTIFASW